MANHVSFGCTSSAEWVESVWRSSDTISDVGLLLGKLATFCWFIGKARNRFYLMKLWLITRLLLSGCVNQLMNFFYLSISASPAIVAHPDSAPQS